jgi:aspartate-semialdehyde dehydrogenase
MREPNVVLVGATGSVGQVFLEVLAERRFPMGWLRLTASKRSVGKKLPFNGKNLTVEETTPEAFRDADIVFISVSSSISRELAPLAVNAGAVVIDDSSAFRMNSDVPLVVPEINADDLRHHKGITSIPNCSTTQMVMALYPIHQVNPVRRVIVDTYQSVSGTGTAAVQEMHDQFAKNLKGSEIRAQIYPHQIAFNVLPHIEPFLENGYTQEELKMLRETQKILHAPEIQVSATCVRVPVEIGHSEALHIELSRPMSVQEVRKILSKFPGVTVVDDPTRDIYPLPIKAAGYDDVFVGRIRQDTSHPNGIAMWIVSDNLRKGAATNAVQIAEELVKLNLFPHQRT